MAPATLDLADPRFVTNNDVGTSPKVYVVDGAIACEHKPKANAYS